MNHDYNLIDVELTAQVLLQAFNVTKFRLVKHKTNQIQPTFC